MGLTSKESKLDLELELIETYKKYSNSNHAIREIECQRVQILNNLVPPEKEQNIVGSITMTYSSFSGFSEPDYGGYYLIFDTEFKKEYSKYSFEDRAKIDQIKEFWSGKTTYDKLVNSYATVERLLYRSNIGESVTRMGGAVPNYKRLLQEGINEYKKRINSKIENEKNEDRLALYRALLKTCGLIEEVSKYYSREVTLLAEKECNKKEKGRLIRISNICKKVPLEPVNSFQEALQAIWFIIITGRFYNLGRFDQYMYPYYENDIKKGYLKREEAHNLLREFWTNFHLLESGMYEFSPGKQTPLLSHIGRLDLAGLKPSGESGVNELTYLCLEVTRELKFENPSIVVRWFNGIPEKIMDLCFEMLKEGASNPAFYNDKIGIKLMEKMGFPLEDAHNYIIKDCGEISIEGKSYGSADSAFYVIKCLDLALHDGKLPGEEIQLGPKTGDVSNFSTFEDLLNAYFKQVEYVFPKIVNMADKADYIRGKEAAYLFRSLLVDDCIEKGKGLFRGGPKYNWQLIELHSMTNVYDSLAAIKKIVCDQKKITISELVEILDKDFEGAEYIRQILLNKAPKFGNDDEYVDEIAQRVLKHLVDLSNRCKTKWRKDGVTVENISTNLHIIIASETNASPDGRKFGMPFASSIGPTAGLGKEGPTAVLKSVAKLTKDILNGSSQLNMSFDYTFLNNIETRKKVIDLVETYFKIGGAQIQIIVSSKDTLLEAQKNPEKYPNLLVRVGGFSAKFIDLSKETQDEIINRTFHALP